MAASNTFVQHDGPRAGQTYTLIQSGGNNYRRYQNGDTVLVGPSSSTASAGAGTAHLPAAPAAPPSNAPVSTPGNVASQGAVPVAAPDIRDATFNAALTQLLGSTQNQRTALEQEGQFDVTNEKEALRRLALQRSDSLKNTTDSDNKQGLFYSGTHGKRMGDVNESYNQQDSDQETGLAQRQQSRQQQLDAIGNLTADPTSPYGYAATGGAQGTLGALLAEAADRRVGALANDPAPVAAAAPQAPAAAVPVASPAPGRASNVFTQSSGSRIGQTYRVIQRGGRSYRDYGNGTPLIPIG